MRILYCPESSGPADVAHSTLWKRESPVPPFQDNSDNSNETRVLRDSASPPQDRPSPFALLAEEPMTRVRGTMGKCGASEGRRRIIKELIHMYPQ